MGRVKKQFMQRATKDHSKQAIGYWERLQVVLCLMCKEHNILRAGDACFTCRSKGELCDSSYKLSEALFKWRCTSQRNCYVQFYPGFHRGYTISKIICKFRPPSIARS